eukprot:g1226.t1
MKILNLLYLPPPKRTKREKVTRRRVDPMEHVVQSKYPPSSEEKKTEDNNEEQQEPSASPVKKKKMTKKESMVGAVTDDSIMALPYVHAADADGKVTNVSLAKDETGIKKKLQIPLPEDTDESMWTTMLKKQQQSKILTPILGFVTRRVEKFTKKLQFQTFAKANPKGCVLFGVKKMSKAQIVLEGVFVPVYARTHSDILLYSVVRHSSSKKKVATITINFGSFDVPERTFGQMLESILRGGVVATSTMPHFTAVVCDDGNTKYMGSLKFHVPATNSESQRIFIVDSQYKSVTMGIMKNDSWKSLVKSRDSSVAFTAKNWETRQVQGTESHVCTCDVCKTDSFMHGIFTTSCASDLAKYLSIEVENLQNVMKKMKTHLCDVSVVAIAMPREGGEMVIGLRTGGATERPALCIPGTSKLHAEMQLLEKLDSGILYDLFISTIPCGGCSSSLARAISEKEIRLHSMTFFDSSDVQCVPFRRVWTRSGVDGVKIAHLQQSTVKVKFTMDDGFEPVRITKVPWSRRKRALVGLVPSLLEWDDDKERGLKYGLESKMILEASSFERTDVFWNTYRSKQLMKMQNDASCICLHSTHTSLIRQIARVDSDNEHFDQLEKTIEFCEKHKRLIFLRLKSSDVQ